MIESSEGIATTKTNSIIDISDPSQKLFDDVNSLWCTRNIDQPNANIAVLENIPSSFEFLRDYINPSIPCIIQNSMLVSEGYDKGEDRTHPLILSLDDLINMQNKNDTTTNMISVNVTPDGHGDCIRNIQKTTDSEMSKMFVTPLERQMTLSEFRDKLRNNKCRELKSDCMDKIFPLANDENINDLLHGCNDDNLLTI